MQTAVTDLIGVLVEAIFAVVLGSVIYRVLAGRFLVPKREMVLPYHRGVLIGKNGQARVVEAGRCWVRPGQKLLLCDVRPRSFQLEGYRALAADGSVVRLSFSGEYKVIDPVVFLASSANANEKFQFEVRRVVSLVCRRWTGTAAASAVEFIGTGVLQAMRDTNSGTGLELVSFQVWEFLVQAGAAENALPDAGFLQ